MSIQGVSGGQSNWGLRNPVRPDGVSKGTGDRTESGKLQGESEGALKKSEELQKESAKDERLKFRKESPEQIKLRNSEEKQIATKIKEMAAKEANVIQHERMHLLAGGSSAGAPSYVYETGPDGKRYVSGGEVTFYAGGNNPESVAKSFEQVKKAAAMVQDPSNADLHAAAMAASTAKSAKTERVILETREKAENQRLQKKEEEQLRAAGAESTAELKERPMIDKLAAKAMVSAYSNMKFKVFSKYEASI